MEYNLYISTFLGTFNILGVNESQLSKIINIYDNGLDSCFINGKKYFFKDLNEIQIFSFDGLDTKDIKVKSVKQLLDFCKKNQLVKKTFGGSYLSPELLENFGNNLTDKFIMDDFGSLIEKVENEERIDLYVSQSRIEEFMNIESSGFDYTKLIALLKELNISYKNGLVFTIPMIVRSIIDHVPPIFGHPNFKQVCANSGTKSFKDSMNHLNNSSRKIADGYLHTTIRKSETLPSSTQIDFKQDLDVLLQEIIRINKESV